MDGAFGELIFHVIKFSFLFISIFGVLRILILRKDTKKHNLTKILTLIFLVSTLYLFTRSYITHQKEMKELAGNYSIEYYKCEKCINCIAKLKSDGTYVLKQNKQILDTGDWDFTKTLVTPFIIFNNGNEQQINSNRTISYIKNNNCQEYWRNQNLAMEINGIIIKIDSLNKHYGVFAIEVENAITKKIIKYEPKYMSHPWLNNKIMLGDKIYKEKNSMIFIVKKSDGDSIIINERIELKN